MYAQQSFKVRHTFLQGKK